MVLGVTKGTEALLYQELADLTILIAFATLAGALEAGTQTMAFVFEMFWSTDEENSLVETPYNKDEPIGYQNENLINHEVLFFSFFHFFKASQKLLSNPVAGVAVD